MKNGLDIEKLTNDWINYVDGAKIFPKLQVHIRLYLEKWMKNRRVNDAVEKSKNTLSGLQKLFHIATEYFSACNSLDVAQNNTNVLITSAIQHSLTPCSRTAVNMNLNNCQIVGGLMIGIPDAVEIVNKGFRGKDLKKRKQRVCSWCSINHISTKDTCRGRGGKRYCEHKNNSS